MTEGRRGRRREEMRQRLLIAALTLFAEHGFSATTLDEIAQQADVARQTVLNHYPTKTDFVRAWGRRRREEAEALITDSASAEIPTGRAPTSGAADTAPARTSLHQFYRGLGRINERERALTRAIHRDQYQALAPERPVPDALLALINRAHSTGEVRPGLEARVLAEILTGVYFDTLSRWLGPHDPPFDLTEEIVARIDVVLDGAAPRNQER